MPCFNVDKTSVAVPVSLPPVRIVAATVVVVPPIGSIVPPAIRDAVAPSIGMETPTATAPYLDNARLVVRTRYRSDWHCLRRHSSRSHRQASNQRQYRCAHAILPAKNFRRTTGPDRIKFPFSFQRTAVRRRKYALGSRDGLRAGNPARINLACPARRRAVIIPRPPSDLRSPGGAPA